MLPRASVPLILLVGSEDRLTVELIQTHMATSAPLIHLSRLLGLRLLEQTPRERQRLANRAFRDILQPHRGQLTLLDRTALLFLPELTLNPLQLLIDTARAYGPVVAAWAGAWTPPTLTYALPGHPEHRSYHQPDALIALA
jgi:hypothetical protein